MGAVLLQEYRKPTECADVAELADALGSGLSVRKDVEVQVLSSAPIRMKMPEERSEASSHLNEFVARVKRQIPPMEHGALDSRVEQLLNDSSADMDDVITILRREFGLAHDA